MNAAQIRSLGRTIELCGFGRASNIRPLPRKSRWHIRDKRCEWRVFDGDNFVVFYTGSRNECHELDSAYCAGTPTKETA